MTYRHKFINLYQSITDNVRNKTGSANTDTEGNRTKDEGDRRTTCQRTDTGRNRRIAEQEAHERRGLYGIQSLYCRLRKGEQTGKSYKGSCIKEGQAHRTTRRSIIYPSFLFSYPFSVILQSIDDVCLHINPLLLSYLLQTNAYIPWGLD